QALVDEKRQIIVHAEAFSSQDHENLAPMMAGAKKNMQAIGKGANYFAGKQLTADSNYHSLASLALCKAEGLDAYIPDIQFRQRDGRFAGQPGFKDGISRPPGGLCQLPPEIKLFEWVKHIAEILVSQGGWQKAQLDR
ncbi:MAG: hypothetical protein PHD58_02580, partial [Anaerolineales bacterium]|nr:hypothetical protein [Anaerolineales bacterium]